MSKITFFWFLQPLFRKGDTGEVITQIFRSFVQKSFGFSQDLLRKSQGCNLFYILSKIQLRRI